MTMKIEDVIIEFNNRGYHVTFDSYPDGTVVVSTIHKHESYPYGAEIVTVESDSIKGGLNKAYLKTMSTLPQQHSDIRNLWFN